MQNHLILRARLPSIALCWVSFSNRKSSEANDFMINENYNVFALGLIFFKFYEQSYIFSSYYRCGFT